jgi:hypothetical protein
VLEPRLGPGFGCPRFLGSPFILHLR